MRLNIDPRGEDMWSTLPANPTAVSTVSSFPYAAELCFLNIPYTHIQGNDFGANRIPSMNR